MDINEMSPREIIEERESIAEVAEFAYEAARQVCHVDIHSVPTMYRVIAEFYNAAAAIGTASENMATGLTRAAAQGDLYEARPGRDVDQGIAEGRAALSRAHELAAELNAVLQAAQSAISGIGHRDEDGNAGL